MNALATLKNAFIRTVKAQEALLAAKMEEEIWLFRGKLRALFQDLGFTQEINAGHLDKSKSLQFKNQPWSFLKVSEQYILGDCKALFQVLGMLKLEK
jgi:hypothetical protein